MIQVTIQITTEKLKDHVYSVTVQKFIRQCLTPTLNSIVANLFIEYLKKVDIYNYKSVGIEYVKLLNGINQTNRKNN